MEKSYREMPGPGQLTSLKQVYKLAKNVQKGFIPFFEESFKEYGEIYRASYYGAC